MKSKRLLAAGLVAFGLGSVLFAQVAVKHFQPPRTAVVDTLEVIEMYRKKADLERGFRTRVEEVTKELDGLERQLKQIEAELKLVEEGTDEHRRMLLRKTELGLELNDRNVKVRRELEESRSQVIQELRGEVEKEIEKYAVAHDLDLVVEKKIPIEGRGNVQINIPIIRYVKPEIEITREIAEILNERYARAPAPVPAANGAKKEP
jgi:Skp family chaperone for outer membrane proteins